VELLPDHLPLLWLQLSDACPTQLEVLAECKQSNKSTQAKKVQQIISRLKNSFPSVHG
jgi:hypothetical protein